VLVGFLSFSLYREFQPVHVDAGTKVCGADRKPVECMESKGPMVPEVIRKPGIEYLYLPRGSDVTLTPGNVGDLIGICLGENVSCILLDEEHFPPDFFQLGSLEAGEILQKTRSYGIRLAAIAPPGRQYPERFRMMLVEETRGGHFGMFPDRQQAEEWFQRTT
jgi:hypothetical protein